MGTTDWATWSIAAAATAGVLFRPFAWPEFVWAMVGAVLLVLLGLLPLHDALIGAARGTDVYLFLVGMMLLSELARQQGLFDWLAAHAARRSAGSARRLFTLIYAVGTVVTVFLSNDATAVVLTPAVAAVVRVAQAKEPLPYLFTCAFIANAASFVLPISNPANLVIYGSHMPPLSPWIRQYAVPSVVSIVTTYIALRLTQSRHLSAPVSTAIEPPILAVGGRLAAAGIALTALVLLTSSYFDIALGLPTFVSGLAAVLAVLLCTRCGPLSLVRGISWGILPLVAGLFVLVEALEQTGLTGLLGHLVADLLQRSQALAAWTVGVVLAVGCNLVNNLPAGLLAGRVVSAAPMPEHLRGAVLIGIDLGPNLSVTGSLATILWLTALRREGHGVGALTFLKLGAVVMPFALVLTLATLFAS